MAIKFDTPLADKWAQVPKKYRDLAEQGKMSFTEALTYAVEAPSPKRSLDTTPVERGSALEDTALALRTGTNTATSGIVGTPVALLNAVMEPKWAGELQEFAGDVTGNYNPSAVQVGRALLDESNPTGFIDTLRGKADPEVYGPRGLRQPDAVRGIQEQLSYNSQEDVKERSSKSLEKGLDAMGKADTTKDAIKVLIDNPKIAPYLLTQQVPNLVINRIPGSTAGTITAQAVNAGASTESDVYQALQKEVEAGRMTQVEAEEKAAEAGQRSTLINIAMPAVFGETGRVTERLLAGQVSKEVAKDAVKKSVVGSAAKAAAVNAVEEYTTEGAEQISQNVATGQDAFQGAGAAGAFGALTGATIGGPSGAAETVVQNNQIAEQQRIQQEFETGQKELDAAISGKASEKQSDAQLQKEADALRQQIPTKQAEMPFGSALAGDSLENDRVPTIVDMFSGESMAAPRAEAQVQQAKQALVDYGAEGQVRPQEALPLPENDQEFEKRKAREAITKVKVEDRYQSDFEKTQADKLLNKQRLLDAKSTVENSKDVLSTASIKQEVNTKLAQEVAKIVQRPFNRTPQGQAALPTVVAKYTAQRTPELTEEVKTSRIKQVNEARDMVELEDRKQLAREVIKDDVQIKKAEEQRVAKEKRAAVPTGTQSDMFTPSTPKGTQESLPLSAPTQPKAVLETEVQKLAAGQLERQRQTSVPKAPEAVVNPQQAAIEKKVAAVDKRMKASAKRKETIKTNQRIQSLLKKEKDVDKVVAIMAKESPETVIPKEQSDKLLDEMITKATGNKEAPSDSDFADERGAATEEQTHHREAVDKAVKSNNSKELLDTLGKDETIDEDQRWLAKKLSPLVEKMGVKLKSPEGLSEGVAGVYTGSTNSVAIKKAAPKIILHEYLHSATSNLIKHAKYNPVVAESIKTLDSVKNEFHKYLRNSPEYKDGTKTKAYDSAIKVINNAEEMLAYGMTERSVKDILKEIPLPGPKKQTAWQSFKDAIINLFRPRTQAQRNALDAVIEATESLVDFADTRPKTVARAQESATLAASPKSDEAVLNEIGTNVELGNRSYNILSRDTKNSLAGAIVDAVAGNTGNKKGVTNPLRHKEGMVSSYLQQAEAQFRAAETAIDKLAAEQKRDRRDVAQQFNKAVVAWEEMPNGEEKKSAAYALVRNFGEAAKAHFDARRTIDALSIEILVERKRQGTAMTAKELATYNSIASNIGKYYTRRYAANLDKIGDAYATDLLSKYKRVQKGKARPGDAEDAAKVQAAVDFVKDNYAYIPEDEALEDMTMAQLTTLAQVWGATPSDTNYEEVNREAWIEALGEVRESLGDENQALENRATQMVKDLLLDNSEASITKYFRGAKQDRTIVEARQDVPRVIRELLGEYQDVSVKAMATISAQAEFLFNTKALGEIKRSEQAKGPENSKLLTAQQFAEQGMDTEQWTRLEGESYGPIAGMYAENSLYRTLADSRTLSLSLKQIIGDGANASPWDTMKTLMPWAAEKYASAIGVLKLGQLVVNPFNAAMNFGGGPLIMLSNGNYNIHQTGRALQTAINLVKAQTTDVKNDDVSKVLRTNTVDSAYVGSLKRAEIDKIESILLARAGSKAHQEIVKKWSRTKEGARALKETYAMADVVWKIHNLFEREKMLTEFHKKNGDNWTPEAIEREAGESNNLTNFSYSMVPKLFRNLDKYGVSFLLPYMYEAHRAPLYSIAVGIGDIRRAEQANTPAAASVLRRSGYKRIMGATASLGIAQYVMFKALGLAAAAISGGDDEEDQKMIDSIRFLLPEYKKYADLYVGGKDKDGNLLLLEYSRVDPFGPHTELYKMALAGATSDEMIDHLKHMYITNPNSESILSMLSAFLEDEEAPAAQGTKIQRISPKAYELLSDIASPSAIKAMDRAIPSWVARATDPENTTVEDGSAADKGLSWLIKGSGGAMVKVDADRSASFVGKQFAKDRKDLTTKLANEFKTQTELTSEEFVQLFTELSVEENKAFDKISGMYEGLIKLGYSKAEAAALINPNKQINKSDMADIRNGTYNIGTSNLISRKSLKTLKANAKKDETREENLRTMRNIDTAVDTIKKAGLPTRE